ncbi:MAG: hypothetical protein SGARI_004359 [Bacillariaceae sp.]
MDEAEKECFQFNIDLLKRQKVLLLKQHDEIVGAAASLAEASSPTTASDSMTATKQVTPLDKFSNIKINKRKAALDKNCAQTKKAKASVSTQGKKVGKETPLSPSNNTSDDTSDEEYDADGSSKNDKTRIRWTKEEDKKLLQAVGGSMTFENIALKIFKGLRTRQAVQSRYYKLQKSQDPNSSNKRWTEEEDHLLDNNLDKILATNSWAEVEPLFPGRSKLAVQLRAYARRNNQVIPVGGAQQRREAAETVEKNPQGLTVPCNDNAKTDVKSKVAGGETKKEAEVMMKAEATRKTEANQLPVKRESNTDVIDLVDSDDDDDTDVPAEMLLRAGKEESLDDLIL